MILSIGALYSGCAWKEQIFVVGHSGVSKAPILFIKLFFWLWRKLGDCDIKNFPFAIDQNDWK